MSAIDDSDVPDTDGKYPSDMVEVGSGWASARPLPVTDDGGAAAERGENNVFVLPQAELGEGTDRWADADADIRRRASIASRRPLVVSAGIAILATVAVLPASTHQLGASVSFVTAMLSVVACFDILSVYLLVGDYRVRGDLRLLMMSWAYAWSLIVMGGYALAFPGVVSLHPPLALTPSMAPYFYITWHAGFPLILGAAWAPWPHRWIARTPEEQRRRRAFGTVAVAIVAAAAAVALLSLLAHQLPVLINGLDTHRMTTLTAPVTIPLVVLALIVAVRGTRTRSGPERWSGIAILICLCDLLLTYYSRSRYSLGWYSGRTLTLVAAAVVLLAMLDSFRRLKAQAEHDASTDPLTGLGNRRRAYEALDQLVARCQRSGASLGVLSLDLDLFKHINDQYGHEAGDEVLAETGRVLLRSCRAGDVVSRVGGEEFLILLPDTDQRGALAAAEKIRLAVAALTVPSMHERVTASLGVTTLGATDLTASSLLRRADAALYQAKQTGRNRTVEVPPVLMVESLLAADRARG